jgi:hypothetical protein
MLEIVRGRSWKQEFTVLDNEDGPMTDLSIFDSFKCQIRHRDAIKDKNGFFNNLLAQEVTVDTEDSVITLTLTAQQTTLLKNGVYVIDVIGTSEEGNESLLDPEPIAVTNRPTFP